VLYNFRNQHKTVQKISFGFISFVGDGCPDNDN